MSYKTTNASETLTAAPTNPSPRDLLLLITSVNDTVLNQNLEREKITGTHMNISFLAKLDTINLLLFFFFFVQQSMTTIIYQEATLVN